MAKTASNMLALGTLAPFFSLYDTITGKKISLKSSLGTKAYVIMFICNHCPYVQHVSKEISQLANEYIKKDVNFFAISSNDIINYPEDSPENMKQIAQEEAYPFPYLFDETQEVAKAYQAACTPDFYLFDSNLRLVYRGQLDNSRPGNSIPVTGESLRYALDCIINNKPIDIEQKPSLGCNIKWKSTHTSF